MVMQTRRLGELKVSAVGFGAMGFSHGYGPGPGEDEAERLMRDALELGCTFFDTAEGYGAGENERLVGRALAPVRDRVTIATKFMIREPLPAGEFRRQVRGRLEASLRRLGTDRVDLYYQHRVPDAIPVEEVAAAMGELIGEGKILGWGQSQAREDQIRAAHAVTPVSAVQSEYSMMERSFEQGVIPACAELGIGFVAFSPLASGFLSGRYRPDDTYTGNDVRRVITRFEQANMRANQPLLDLLAQLAGQHHATPAQVSLAWMLHKEPFIVPIPGMRSLERIKENLGAASVQLTSEDFAQIEAGLSAVTIHGNRTDEDIARLRSVT
jgi:aryl-alcohol dehydrogenase-like predicted oxidoreductase